MMTQKKVYPINYVQAVGPKASATKNLTVARQLVEEAVPEGGEPLTVEQLRQIVCGRPGRTYLKVGVDDMADIVAAVLDPRSTVGVQSIEEVSSLDAADVEAVCDQVIEARASTVTLPKADPEPIEELGEIGELVR